MRPTSWRLSPSRRAPRSPTGCRPTTTSLKLRSATTPVPGSVPLTRATSRGGPGSTCPATAAATRPTSAGGSRTTSSMGGCPGARPPIGASNDCLWWSNKVLNRLPAVQVQDLVQRLSRGGLEAVACVESGWDERGLVHVVGQAQDLRGLLLVLQVQRGPSRAEGERAAGEHVAPRSGQEGRPQAGLIAVRQLGARGFQARDDHHRDLAHLVGKVFDAVTHPLLDLGTLQVVGEQFAG